MASINRDIAKILGLTEAANPSNAALSSGITVYATPDLLPSSGLTAGDQAFVTSNSRIYISTGSGWYNVALINSTPTFTTGPDATYALSNDLTPTVITLLAQDSDGQVVTYSASDSGMTGIATLSQDSSVFTITPLTDSAGGNIGTFTITFQATDGIGIASELSTFTLSFGPDWSFAPTETILRASDAQAGDLFGYAVSISDDGIYAIVGAQSEDYGSGDPISGAGAAYIFTRSGSTWTEQAILRETNAQASDLFGCSVSISSDGSYAIVGAKYEDTGGSNAGAAYIFTRSGSTWTQQAKLLASDIEAGDYFGESVSINSDGTYAIIGSIYEDTSGTNAGSAYIFTRSGSTWTQQQKIQATDKEYDSYFGCSVSINPDATYVAIGSSRDDSYIGSTYVFTRSGSTWTQQAKLTASDATAGYRFGNKCKINSDGTYIIVGSYYHTGVSYGQGAAYIFSRSGSTWTQQAMLVGEDSDRGGSDYFGSDVSISGDGSYAVVGCEQDGLPATYNGAAYVFERTGSTWTQQQKILASDAQAYDYFGSHVDINSDGSYVIVGAGFEDTGGTTAGSAYIYDAS